MCKPDLCNIVLQQVIWILTSQNTDVEDDVVTSDLNIIPNPHDNNIPYTVLRSIYYTQIVSTRQACKNT